MATQNKAYNGEHAKKCSAHRVPALAKRRSSNVSRNSSTTTVFGKPTAVLIFQWEPMMKAEHTPNQRIKERERAGPHLTAHEHMGLNGRIAVAITNAVGTMWCAYVFAAIALVSLPSAIQGGVSTLISWIAQTFLQLVLLSVIMVGQRVSAAASDKQALQTYKDAEALLKIQDEVRRLIEINNELTDAIHGAVIGKGPSPADPLRVSSNSSPSA
ncbi:hypothetical protein LJR034_001438 [Caballeronia sp. LjRoot34]|uniref:hypothetical protein n=1 Tax=Caballeronia sp. LjRoot34 TaxID=3342325 RepID=UPI003ECF3A09